MMNDLVIKLKVDGAAQASADLNRVTTDAKKLGAAVQDGAKSGRDWRQMAADVAHLGTAAYLASQSFGAILGSVKGIVGPLIEAQRASQSLAESLAYSQGGARGAARELEYLRDTAYRLGLDFSTSAKAYANFAAATKESGVTAEQTRTIFEGVAQASAKMGLSAAETEGALLALSQMAGKGVVSAEELRGQLGERLPGAFNLAAKAMGVTTQQLNKMLETGQIMASDFLPKFGAALKSEFVAPMNTLTQEINRAQSAWDNWKRSFADMDGAVFAPITGGLSESAAAMRALGEDAGLVYRILVAIGGLTLGAIGRSQFNLEGRKTELLQQIAELENEIRAQESRGVGLYGRGALAADKDRLAELKRELDGISFSRGQIALPNLKEEFAAQQAAIAAASDRALADFESKFSTAAQKQAAKALEISQAYANAYAAISEDDPGAAAKRLALLKQYQVALADLEKSGQKGAAGPRAVRAEMDALGVSILAWNDAEKERTKLAAEYAQSITNYMRPLEEQARTLESQLETYGLTERQIQLTTVARLEEARAIAAANGALPEHLNFLDREIELRRRIAAASGQMEVREANTEAARQAEEDWRRTSQAIEDALIDALMNGGKSGAEYIEGLFRSMVLRPIVQAIVQPIAGGITSAMGFGSPGAGGAGGNLLSMASNLSSLSSIGGSLGMMAGSFGAGTTMTATQLGNLANAGLVSPGAATAGWGAANLGPGLAAYGLGQKYGVLGGLAGGVGTSALVGGIGGLASGAGFMSGAGTALAGLGPAGWAAIAVGAILGSIMGNKKPSDKSSWATVDPTSGRVSDLGSMTGKKDPGQEQRDATAALAAEVGRFAAQAGVDSALKVMIGQRDGIRLELMDGWLTPQGAASNGGGANLLNYGSDFQSSFAAMLDDLIDEGTLDSETVDLWRKMKTDMVGVARDADELISTLSLLVAGYDEATIERANLLQAEGEALESALGRMLQIETALSGTALPGDALAQAAGEMVRQLEALALSAIPTTNTALSELVTGLDLTSAEGQKTYQALMALAPAFVEIQAAQKALYDQLYTDEQRAANLAQDLGEAFAQLGVAMPATRDEMRALIDAQDTSTEAGAKMRAQLLGLVPAFVEVSDAAATMAQEMLRNLERERASLQSRIYSLSGDTASLRAEELAAINPANWALQARIWALQDEAQANQIATEAARAAAAATEQAAQNMRALGEAGLRVRDYVQGLRAGDASGMTGAEQYAATRRTYMADLSGARGNDLAALGRVTGSADDYLRAARATAGSADVYRSIVARTAAELSALPAAKSADELLLRAVQALDKTVAATAEASSLKITKVLDASNDALVRVLTSGFSALDANADDQLTRAELEAAFVKTGLATAEDVDRMISRYDRNGDRILSRMELILGSTNSLGSAVTSGFTLLDANLDDQLSEEELINALVKTGLATDIDIERLIRSVDVNGDRILSKAELQLAETRSLTKVNQQIREGFTSIDMDLDGLLTAAELEAAFVKTKLATSGDISAMMRLYDLNGDGMISELEKIEANTRGLAVKITQNYYGDTVSSGGGSTGTGTYSYTAIINGQIYEVTGTRPWTASGYAEKNPELVTFYNQNKDGIAALGQGSTLDAYLDYHFRTWGIKENRKFRTGGAFTNSIVQQPTAFDLGLMGEAGPEAIMPLTNINGSLGVRAEMPGFSAMLAELKQLRAELAEIKATSAATARHTHETSRNFSRVSQGGNAVLVEAIA
jgi:tape measure domain-containing protein